MPEVDIPRLRKALEWCEEQAAKPFAECEWLQMLYVVPVDVEGAVEQWYGHFSPSSKASIAEELKNYHLGKTCGDCYCFAGYVVNQVDGVVIPGTAGKRAMTLLGLTYDQSVRLFSGYNSIERLREIAEEIAGEPL